MSQKDVWWQIDKEEENTITPKETVWWQVAEEEENSITKMDVHKCAVCSKKFSSDRAMRQHHRDKHEHEEEYNNWKGEKAKQKGGGQLTPSQAFFGLIILVNFRITIAIGTYLFPSESEYFRFPGVGFIIGVMLGCYLNWRFIKWAVNKFENLKITSWTN